MDAARTVCIQAKSFVRIRNECCLHAEILECISWMRFGVRVPIMRLLHPGLYSPPMSSIWEEYRTWFCGAAALSFSVHPVVGLQNKMQCCTERISGCEFQSQYSNSAAMGGVARPPFSDLLLLCVRERY